VLCGASRGQRHYEGETLSLKDKNTKPKEQRKMQNETQTATQKPDIPKWSALLVEAVNKPGLIMDAYSAFWNYVRRVI
jgi:hypothetical protein